MGPSKYKGLLLLVLAILFSCGDPLTDLDILKAADVVDPVITILSPSNGEDYSTEVTVTGSVTDLADDQGTEGDIVSCMYSLNGSTAQETFEPDSGGLFRFTFSTADMVGRITIEITAEDWNGNTSTATLFLNAPMSIVSFRFEADLNIGALSEDVIGEISGTDITVSMAGVTDITDLVATFEMTGVIIQIGEINQVSGATPHDFTSPVLYTVTANNWDTRTYTVTVINTPLAPTGLNAVTSAWNRIDLSWNDTNIESGYEIQRKIGADGTYTGLPDNDENVNSLSDDSLSAATTYVYRVRAVNADGASPWSEEASAETEQFSLETVDSSSNFRWPRIGIDENDTPHIVYYDYNNNQILYTLPDETGWSLPASGVVDAGEVPEAGYAMTVSPGGIPHVAWAAQSNGALKHSTRDGSSWTAETVDDTGMFEVEAVALDGSGYPHICYTTEGSLKYAYKDGTGWNVSTIETVVGGEAGGSRNIVLDSSGNSYVCYAHSLDSNRTLKYAQGDGSTWETFDIVYCGHKTGGFPIDLDPAGYLHIIYNNTSNKLCHAWQDGTGWQTETIDSTTSSGSGEASMQIDALGSIHVCYEGSSSSGLHYALRDGTGWDLRTLDSVSTVGVSLGLDGNGRVYIAYSDYIWPSPSSLKYIRDMRE